MRSSIIEPVSTLYGEASRTGRRLWIMRRGAAVLQEEWAQKVSHDGQRWTLCKQWKDAPVEARRP